jgi:hypothetical protein
MQTATMMAMVMQTQCPPVPLRKPSARL